MGQSNLPKIFVDSEAEIPSASKWNDNFNFLNFTYGSFVKNGSFEFFSGTVPISWTLSGTGAASASNADSKHGALAVNITFGSATAILKQSSTELKFLKGRRVKAFAWVKTTVPNQARLKVNDGVAVTASAYHSGGGAYELLVVEHIVAGGATTVDLELHVESAGSALFDAAVLLDFEDALGFVAFISAGGEAFFSSARVVGTAPAPPQSNTLYSENVPKAWVKFAGATGVIASSFNVLSVVRNATGEYTVTFRTAFANADYVMVGSGFETTPGDNPIVRLGAGAPAVGSCSVKVVTDNGGALDPDAVMLVFFGTQS